MITTFTQRTIDPSNFSEKDVCIEDIAHSLALVNRFGGHAKIPISVGYHSLWVCRLCEPSGCGLHGLLHDASEAYLGDITKWIKQTPPFAAYRELEDHFQQTIFRWAGLSVVLPPAVEWADKLMVRFEVTQAYRDDWIINHPNYPPLNWVEKEFFEDWNPPEWPLTKRQFLVKFRALWRA